jgi:hypothetical protein
MHTYTEALKYRDKVVYCQFTLVVGSYILRPFHTVNFFNYLVGVGPLAITEYYYLMFTDSVCSQLLFLQSATGPEHEPNLSSPHLVKVPQEKFCAYILLIVQSVHMGVGTE